MALAIDKEKACYTNTVNNNIYSSKKYKKEIILRWMIAVKDARQLKAKH